MNSDGEKTEYGIRKSLSQGANYRKKTSKAVIKYCKARQELYELSELRADTCEECKILGTFIVTPPHTARLHLPLEPSLITKVQ